MFDVRVKRKKKEECVYRGTESIQLAGGDSSTQFGLDLANHSVLDAMPSSGHSYLPWTEDLTLYLTNQSPESSRDHLEFIQLEVTVSEFEPVSP